MSRTECRQCGPEERAETPVGHVAPYVAGEGPAVGGWVGAGEKAAAGDEPGDGDGGMPPGGGGFGLHASGEYGPGAGDGGVLVRPKASGYDEAPSVMYGPATVCVWPGARMKARIA